MRVSHYPSEQGRPNLDDLKKDLKELRNFRYVCTYGEEDLVLLELPILKGRIEYLSILLDHSVAYRRPFYGGHIGWCLDTV